MDDTCGGAEPFRRIRDGGSLYADRSPLVSRILERNDAEAFLFTRPHGFGKTLALSMLAAYFGRDAGRRFDDLEIIRLRPDDPEMGAYPVVFLSLGGLDTGTEEGFEADLSARIAGLYGEHGCLSDSDRLSGRDREDYRRMLGGGGDLSDLRESLSDLCIMLKRHHGVGPVLLIDDYDDPLNSSRGSGTQEGIRDIVGGLLGNVLKSEDPPFRLAVVMGMTPLRRTGLSSRLDNLLENGVSDKGFEGLFGRVGGTAGTQEASGPMA
ncbi:MAG: AAA family ATPase [Thermoplasmata archaeon]|nr:AAA family ATPase [Thermoplasmata archaeon]